MYLYNNYVLYVNCLCANHVFIRKLLIYARTISYIQTIPLCANCIFTYKLSLHIVSRYAKLFLCTHTMSLYADYFSIASYLI